MTDFTSIIAVLSVCIIIVVLLTASSVSRKLTIPLKKIHDALNGMDWETFTQTEPSNISSELNELEELQAAFMNMQTKLKETMDAALEARTQEMQATMFALQSQMDPHFIYNMLTIIGIMAEEGMKERISETIEHLTHLLRYISSSVSSVVTIREEIEYAKRYLSCMKIRFQDSLHYSIDIPEPLLCVKVPKLIIQPIIENTMKYGIDTEPPWEVAISGTVSDARWEIIVSDNGPGFPELR